MSPNPTTHKETAAGEDTNNLHNAYHIEPIKKREVEILKMLDQGRANKEIARTLGISVDTVKWYLKSIYAKLGVTRRAQATAEARRLHIIP